MNNAELREATLKNLKAKVGHMENTVSTTIELIDVLERQGYMTERTMKGTLELIKGRLYIAIDQYNMDLGG